MLPATAPSAGQPVVLRMTVRVPDLDSFVTAYARHLDGDRIFIFTKTLQPLGTTVRFGLYLASGELLLQGHGTVTRVQEASENSRRPPGVEIQFVPVDDRSRTLVEFMHAARADLKFKPKVGHGFALPSTTVPPIAGAMRSAPAAPPPALPRAAETKPPPLPGSVPPVPSVVLPTRSAAPAPPDVVSPLLAAALLPPATAAAPVAAPAAAPAAPTPLATPPPSPFDDTVPLSDGTARPPGVKPGAEVVSFAPGLPAADPASGLPANPFSEVPDGAIEFFVEWSLEQSTGPVADQSADQKAVFGNVAMMLPSAEPELSIPRNSPKPALLVGGGVLVGLFVGVLLHRGMTSTPSAPAPVPTAHASTAPASPGANPAPSPSANPAPAPSSAPSAAANPPASPSPNPSPSASAAPSAPPSPGPSRSPSPAPAPVAAAPPVKVPAQAPAPAAAPAPPSASAAAPGAGPGALAIRTTPPGAAIFVDGNPAGTTPTIVNVTPGQHTIRLRRERYVPHEVAVAAPGQLDVALKRPVATLSIRTTPSNATLTVNNAPRGTTPADLKLPGFETYTVRVTFPDGRTAKKQLYLQPPGQTISAALPAAPKPTRR